ncbi:MAG: hypothetical protein COA42_18560 [Alteromonadaceae bacterium]|nr:MAG: hypothetical protein COA42_18560 [Alteromonadaceae bacterium]
MKTLFTKNSLVKNIAATISTAVVLGVSASAFATSSIHIEAENYSASPGNGAVTQWQCGDNCIAMGWLDAGEWMTYDVDLPASSTGQYLVTYRVASVEDFGQLTLERAGGGAQFGSMVINNTGGWGNWQEISHVVTIPSTESALAILVDDGGFNIDWFQIESLASPGENLIVNGNFDNNTAWQTFVDDSARAVVSYGPSSKIFHGLVSVFDGSSEPWDVQLSQNGLTLEQGKTYSVSFDTWGSLVSGTYEVVVQEDGNDYTSYSATQTVHIAPFQENPSQHVEFEFTMHEPTDTNARLTFNVGGMGDLGGFHSFSVGIDNVVIKSK